MKNINPLLISLYDQLEYFIHKPDLKKFSSEINSVIDKLESFCSIEKENSSTLFNGSYHVTGTVNRNQRDS